MTEQGIEEGSLLWNKNFELYLSMKSRYTDTPQFGVFELTPRCNLDCRMCYVHLTADQMNGIPEIDGDKLISLIDQAYEMGMMNVQLTGGEALLHPDFDKIFCHCLDKGLRVSVLTNGLLLTEERIAFFKKHPPYSMQITLYGSDDDSYEKVTDRRVFHQVASNLLSAKALDCMLSVSITPSKYCTAENVLDIIAFCEKNELRCQLNNDLQMPYEGTGRTLDDFNLTEEEFLEIRRALRQAAPVAPETLPDAGESDQEFYGTKCAAGRGMFCLTWGGELKPCLDLPISADPFKKGFVAAWKEINAQTKQFRIPAECTNCGYASLCNQCPALHSQGGESGHVDRRICQRTRKMVAEGLLKFPEERKKD